ncbi:DUF6207 family protein [Streptomyces sp. NPDC059569]|uniref:DUF6207 family protein n=1 Tax=Streptomyces sp. NPDC059569 TaxID=3346869 RepID=UPI00367C2689
MGDSDSDSDGAADDAGAGQPGVRLRCYLDLRQPTVPPAALAAGAGRGSAQRTTVTTPWRVVTATTPPSTGV